MPQVTRCPHCNQSLQLPEGAAGKQVGCPLCHRVFSVRADAPSATLPRTAHGVPGAKPRTEAAPPVRRSRVAAGPSTCPSCKARLPRGAAACGECGFLLNSDTEAVEAENSQNLCPNEACGVANPPGVRLCQRCTSPLPWPAGTVLHERYRIERLLAIGGFAAVYLATDLKQNNREVALKDMICPDPGEFAIRLNFFQREAEILRFLERLPVVPRLYQFVHKGESAQLILEFIRGQDLLKRLEQNKNQPFPLEQVVEWGKGICDVLSHMHNMKPAIVHRDIKPDNIMLMDDGRSIRLIDFGTARDTGRSQKTRLAAKTRVFTEGYAPPEQIIGKPEARSDLFALAGTLYHLATGKAPEGHYTAREIEDELSKPRSTISPDARWLFDLMRINLAEDVNDRYFSCREFKTDLERRSVTKETSCPKCRTMNPVRQPYCRGCASPLTDTTPPCTHCGNTNRMGSRCCIHCGNRLR
jgi:predicted Ser/Thr protein kinase